MRQLVRQYPTQSFILATYILSWSLWSILLITTTPDVMQKGPPLSFFLLAALGGLGPSLSGLATIAFVDGRAGLRDLFSHFQPSLAGIQWYVLILSISPLIGLVSMVVEKTFGMPTATLTEMRDTLPLSAIYPIFAALGEEFGWRGFLLPRLQRQRSSLEASVWVGLAWGLWHIPTQVLAFRQYGLVAIVSSVFVSHILGSTAQSIVMTWLYIKSNESLLVMVLTHYSLTFTAMFMFPLSISSVSTGLQHWLIFHTFYWVVALLAIRTGGLECSVKTRKSQ